MKWRNIGKKIGKEGDRNGTWQPVSSQLPARSEVPEEKGRSDTIALTEEQIGLLLLGKVWEIPPLNEI